VFEQSSESAAFIRTQTTTTPEVALILGSGLGHYADRIQGDRIPYAAIPGFHSSTVQGHSGTLVIGTLNGQSVVAMQGRVHAYEGLSMDAVTFPVRVMWQLGARTLLVTNAAGGMNPAFAPGDLMLIDDQINMTGANPLAGPNDERFGPRFPDMTQAYDPELRALASRVATQGGIDLKRGVYVGALGPTYETPAEVRAFHKLGGDAVGMSTVPEVIVARHMGMRCLGISCITNAAAGLGDGTLNHDEVTDVATRVRPMFISLLDGILRGLTAQDAP